MKRDHPNHSAAFTGGGGGGGVGSSSSTNGSGKAKMWEETEQDGGGIDELMAVLGYKVKSSDMAEVAQKLEQLEQAMCSVEQDGLSQLASETVHYNPSDLSSWLESMLSELNPVENSPALQDPFCTNYPQSSSSSVMIFDDSSFDSDLTAIPGSAVYPQKVQPQPQPPPPPPPLKTAPPPFQTVAPPFQTVAPPPGQTVVGARAVSSSQPPPNKRSKSNSMNSWEMMPSESVGSSVTQRGAELTRPVVLVDSQENGVRLVHTLMACAEAVQQENYKVAEALVKRIGFLAVSQAGVMRKVATYFAEALARRIYKLCQTNPNELAFRDYLEMHFYETCPYLKFAHFTANQAILEAFAGKSRVHVIDFGIKQGMQWPALLQALALRPGGPPSFRLTGIGPPSSDNTDNLQEVGWKLAQLAETINVKFEYRGFVASSLADLDASLFDMREGETIAVNSVFELHQLLARPGAIDKVLSVVKNLRPQILTVVEQEANHNGPVFLDRFTESLHYYSTLFDSLEGCSGGDGGADGSTVSDQDRVMSEVYLGRQICNVVACEGVDRVERHETLAQWRARLNSAGFEPVHLGSNAFKQASMLLALFAGGDGYRVDENNGCLMLGWHTRPLIATSAWRLA